MSTTSKSSLKERSITSTSSTSPLGSPVKLPHIKTKECDGPIVLSPDPPSFGFVCIGFRYKLIIRITNTGSKPERMQILCSPAIFKSYNQTSGIDSSVYDSIRSKNDDFKLLKTLKQRLTAEGGSFVAISRKFKAMDLDGAKNFTIL